MIFDENDFPFKTSHASYPSRSEKNNFSTTLTIIPLDEFSQPSVSSSSSDTVTTPDTPSPSEQSSSSPSSSQSLPPNPSHHMVTRSQTKTLKPKTYPDHHVYSIDKQSITEKEPTCYTQAVKAPT